MHFPQQGKVMWADNVPTNVKLLARILCKGPAVGPEFDAIDSGYYSSVWRHPKAPGMVFKRSRHHRDKDGYRVYAEACMRNPRNPFMPVVYGIIDCMPGVTVYVVEELSPTYGMYTELRGAVDTYLDSVRCGPAVGTGRMESHAAGMDKASLLGAVALIAGIIRDLECLGDCHSGNVMLRGIQLVFTDPLAGVFRRVPDEHRNRPERRSTRKTRIRAEKARKSAAQSLGSPTGPQATTGAF